ncbi:MAG TPA: sporulation protein [Chloroflexota bacterium]|nr:sporulation protein [Chloroflexota bacterium]
MSLHDLVEQARDTITVKRVFGEAYEKDGVTVIPAAMVIGGLGAGEGQGDPAAENGRRGSGTGGGVGVVEWPVGAYVIADGAVTWRPAINVNLVILGGQLVAVAAIWALRGVLKARLRAA